MRRFGGKAAVFLAAALVFYPLMAELFLLALPKPREPLQYMVAGAFATAVTLLGAFVVHAVSVFGRTAPGSGPRS